MFGGQHGRHRSFCDHLAVGERSDALAHDIEAVKVVRHHEDRQSERLMQGSDQIVEISGCDRIEP